MNSPSNNNESPQWQQKALQDVLMEGLKEQRRGRRWRIFFRFTWLILIIFFFLMVFTSHSNDYYKRNNPHVALIKIHGSIMPMTANSAEYINKALEKAFSNAEVKGVILDINSPGGTPVQAGQVYDTLLRLRQKNPQKKVYAVCSDLCASGAYYVAAGADEIYVDKASMVGSIGVLMNGFGFVDTLKKLGISRRLLTAGSEKGFLDPFSPLKTEDIHYAQTMLNTIHEQFIESVKKGRGSRLKLQTPSLFSGLVWTGQEAVNIGLADGLSSSDEVARLRLHTKNIVDYTEEESLLAKFSSGVSSKFAGSLITSLGISPLKPLE